MVTQFPNLFKYFPNRWRGIHQVKLFECIVLGMVDPLRFFTIEIILKGVEKNKLFENIFKMVVENLRLLIVIFI